MHPVSVFVLTIVILAGRGHSHAVCVCEVCYVLKNNIADMEQLVFSCECMQAHSVTINSVLSLWHYC